MAGTKTVLKDDGDAGNGGLLQAGSLPKMGQPKVTGLELHLLTHVGAPCASAAPHTQAWSKIKAEPPSGQWAPLADGGAGGLKLNRTTHATVVAAKQHNFLPEKILAPPVK